MTIRTRTIGVLAVASTLFVPALASGHAQIFPEAVATGHGGFVSLVVPNEKEEATTTTIELLVPEGVAVHSFEPIEGWTRDEVASGSGEERRVERVTWTGSVGGTDAAVFRFVASSEKAGDYSLNVKQTYSDGSISNWDGSGDEPAPTISVAADSGHGESSAASVVPWIALALAGVALAVSLGRRRGAPTA